MNNLLQSYLSSFSFPKSDSHKGQNGKVLVIGGSELFHAASNWSLEVVSRLADMVFYSSIPSNNRLVNQAKKYFWNGIVVERPDLESYLQEAEVVLIGPGMTRTSDTTQITNYLLKKYPHKKWVLDAGALQMMNPDLLAKQMIITPHLGELERLLPGVMIPQELTQANHISESLNKATILLTGQVDTVFNTTSFEQVTGGHHGMTKGGTGDILAGLVAGLYCFTNQPMAAAVIASKVNKVAGEELAKWSGPFFNASDLARQVPRTLAAVIGAV